MYSICFDYNLSAFKLFKKWNFACRENGGTKVNAIGNYNQCNKEDYSSIVRYQTFGIDCCIEEARVSMNDYFSNISEHSCTILG